MKTSERPHLIARLEHTLSGMHYANRTVSNAYGTGLGLAESAILFELLGLPQLSPTELAQRLCLTQVAVSRALKKLEEGKLAERHKSGRSVQVVVSRKGKDAADTARIRARSIFTAAYERLLARDQRWFAAQFDHMLAALGAPDAVSLPDDPPLMQPIRRLFRILGFQAGYSYRFTELSSLEWHILRAVILHPHARSPLLASSIASDLGVSARSIFPVVRRMEGNGWIDRNTGPDDERERPLTVASAGKKIFARATEAALSLLNAGVAEFSNADLERFTRAFELYTGTPLREAEQTLSNQHELIRVRNEEMQQRARGLIIRERAAKNVLSHLPSQLVDPSSDTFAVVSHGALLAVIEIRDGEILHLVDTSDLETRILSDFIAQVVSEVLANQGGAVPREVKVPRSACTPRCWATIAKGSGSADIVLLR